MAKSKLCLDPGDLRHKLQVQSASKVKNGRGGQIETWTTERTVWAAIDATSGGEVFTSGKTEARVTHRIRMRYAPGITPAKRLMLGTRRFDILFVRDIEEKHLVLELKCEERF